MLVILVEVIVRMLLVVRHRLLGEQVNVEGREQVHQVLVCLGVLTFSNTASQGLRRPCSELGWNDLVVRAGVKVLVVRQVLHFTFFFSFFTCVVELLVLVREDRVLLLPWAHLQDLGGIPLRSRRRARRVSSWVISSVTSSGISWSMLLPRPSSVVLLGRRLGRTGI